jgi:chromosome segregation ATPase
MTNTIQTKEEVIKELDEVRKLIQIEKNKLSRLLNEQNAVRLENGKVLEEGERYRKKTELLKKTHDKTVKSVGGYVETEKQHENKVKKLTTEVNVLEKTLSEKTKAFEVQKKETEKTLDKQTKIMNDTFEALQNNIENASKKLLKIQNDITIASSEKTRLETENGRLVASTEQNNNVASILNVKLAQIQSDIEKKTAELTELEDGVENEREELSKAKDAKTVFDGEIVAKQSEIAELKKDIVKIKEDTKKVREVYETEKVKLFSIADREESLRQREAFIKEKYEMAGINYE